MTAINKNFIVKHGLVVNEDATINGAITVDSIVTNTITATTILDPNGQSVAGDWNTLLNKPTLFSGSYDDLTNKPTLFSGSYDDLTNKPSIPTVPTTISSFTNDAGYITGVNWGSPGAIGSTSANTATFTDLTISGDFTVNGTTTVINAVNMEIDDPLIYMGQGNVGNTKDLGFVGHFDNGTYQHTGLVRKVSDGKWYLFSGVTTEPDNNVAWTDPTFTTDTLKANVESDIIRLVNSTGAATLALMPGSTGSYSEGPDYGSVPAWGQYGFAYNGTQQKLNMLNFCWTNTQGLSTVTSLPAGTIITAINSNQATMEFTTLDTWQLYGSTYEVPVSIYPPPSGMWALSSFTYSTPGRLNVDTALNVAGQLFASEIHGNVQGTVSSLSNFSSESVTFGSLSTNYLTVNGSSGYFGNILTSQGSGGAVWDSLKTVGGTSLIGAGNIPLFSGSYNDLTNAPSITPTSVSDQANTSTGYFDVPAGTTAQRPVSPNVGMVRYNTDLGSLEQYTSSGWGTIAQPPSISSVSPLTFNGEQGTSFTIQGSAFGSDAIVKFITSQGAEYSAGSVSRVSSSQLIATTPQDFTVANEPLSIKIIQGSGTAETSGIIDCGGTPAWSTPAGSLGSIYDNVSGSNTIATLLAVDPDAGATVTYSITSGSIPSGYTLNSTTGVISGTYNGGAITNSTIFNFTVLASDNAGNTTSRAFSITVNQSTEAGGGAGLVSALSVTTNGTQLTNTSSTLYHANASYASPNNPAGLFDFTNYGSNSAYFKIHSGHDGVKPTYLCFQVTSGTPRVVNQLRWIKHGNACGNIDIYGSNQSITSGNYQTMGNWTYLGRGYMGGYGSESDGTVKTASFNANGYGYRWYMVLVRDNQGGSLAYPSEGTMGGYAMYGMSIDKV